jgi:thiopeptide-type bacteriocin biosynthesis protein
MKGLVRRKVIGKWFPSVYEPETFKFGGPQAMDAAHAHFFADSLAWWRWQQAHRGTKIAVGSRVLSVCVLNDLFSRFLEGPEEVWDVWCRIAGLHGATAIGDGPATAALRIADIIDRVASGERAVLRKYCSCNEVLARRFRIMHSRGKLLFRYRLVLPHLALYHWNRYGLRPADRAWIFTAMMRAWSPVNDRAAPGGNGPTHANLR